MSSILQKDFLIKFMVLVSLYICDTCKVDGYLRKAVASYIGDNKQEFHCCKKHLSFVVQEGLEISYLVQPPLEITFINP